MFRAMAKKNKVPLADDAIPEVSPDRQLSGADWRAFCSLPAASRCLPVASKVTRDDLAAALDEFIPSAQGLEKELQELAAVLECTERSFLPPDLARSGRPARRCASCKNASSPSAS